MSPPTPAHDLCPGQRRVDGRPKAPCLFCERREPVQAGRAMWSTPPLPKGDTGLHCERRIPPSSPEAAA